MHALLITTLTKRPKALIVEFDPRCESQEEVERRHGVTFSEYFETPAHAKFELERRTCI
jgi:hypothetical protein